VRPSDQRIDDFIDAILDGTPLDWAAAESSDAAERPWIRQLKVLAAIAEFHRGGAPPEPAHHAVLTSHSNANDESVPLWGHLRLLEAIGRGSFGDVYRAWDTRLDREVALKLLPAGSSSGDRPASTIIHEGRLLARVRHSNVVTIYGAEQISDQIGLWMEFVRGETLEQILEQRTVVSTTEAVAIGVELCRAISAVHGAGLLHRDIKTHNVMQAVDGRIVLMDFGTGRELDDDASSDLAGTPLYVAPEVLEGQQATIQSDIYSLGVLLYHLVTGSYPVHGRTVRGVRLAHERGERIPVRTARHGMPSKLARVIERAIHPDPERRYQTADMLGADLISLTRSRTARLAYAAGFAGTSILAVMVGWEAAGRHVGFFRTPSALLMDWAGSHHLGLGSTSPVDRPAIAVLPFKNVSTRADTEYLADGLTDETIRNLAVVKGLQVRSRTSSFAFKDRPRDLQHIAEQLGVNLIVDGAVQRDGNRLRIDVRLVQVEGDILLWTDRFDRELTAVFSIQDQISRGIVNRLGLRSVSGERRYVTNLDAYELYLQAHALVDRRGIPNAVKAADLFQRAISRDPGFARAHAGLANAYAFMSFPYRGVPFETAYPIMRPAALKALQLDPLLAEAHAAMGWVYSYEHDWVNAERAFQRSIALNPSLTQAYTSYSVSTLQPLEKYEEALRLLQVASQHDPLSLDVQREIGEVQLFSGRYAEAVETFARVTDLDPDFPFARSYLARALILSGRVNEALPLLEPGMPFLGLGRAYVMTGRRAEAEKLATEWEGYPYRVAVIAAALGDTERAIEALERTGLSEPHRIGRLLIEPELAPLHRDPRVAAIRKKFGLP
jgi:TolB-like protein/tetratricopeptide (TPR) repeat protein/tRNA A-37 threonylcarbamoyl transferase component Bud32